MTSPLPDIEGVIRRVASKPFRSVLDLTATYEQIRIIPEHVERSAVTTPDGNIVSLVLQMGDCNVPATYQSLMNHIFSPYLGRFLDVYLDDVIIYSDTLDEHVRHCKLAMDVLRGEKLYLSKAKIRFLADYLLTLIQFLIQILPLQFKFLILPFFTLTFSLSMPKPTHAPTQTPTPFFFTSFVKPIHFLTFSLSCLLSCLTPYFQAKVITYILTFILTTLYSYLYLCLYLYKSLTSLTIN